jgi:hypothetical protein
MVSYRILDVSIIYSTTNNPVLRLVHTNNNSNVRTCHTYMCNRGRRDSEFSNIHWRRETLREFVKFSTT